MFYDIHIRIANHILSYCGQHVLCLYSYSDKLLQVIGWSMWFAEYLFLERSWAKDENTLKVFSTLPKELDILLFTVI